MREEMHLREDVQFFRIIRELIFSSTKQDVYMDLEEPLPAHAVLACRGRERWLTKECLLFP